MIRLCIPLVVGMLLAVLPADSFAQRKKKKSTETTDEADLRAAEFYFIEGEKYFILEDYAKALEAYHKCLDIDQENPTVYYKIAQIRYRNEEFEDASSAISEAISLEKGNKFYYQLAADIYSAMAQYDNTAKMYEQLIEEVPDSEEYYFDLAGLYIFQNKWENALDVYSKAEKKFGVIDQIALQKQKVYLKLNKIDDAVEEGRKLMSYYPGEPQYARALAEVMNSNGMRGDAIAVLEGYLAEYGSDGNVEMSLGDFYRLEKRFDESTELLQQAFWDTNVPQNQKIQTLLGYITRFPDSYSVKTARSLGSILLELSPDDPDVLLVNADMYFQMTTFETEAAAEIREKSALYYGKCALIEPGNFNVWQNLLNLDLQLNRWDSLSYHSEVALEYFPNQPAIYWYAGIGTSQQEQYESSVAYLEQGVKMVSNNPQLKNSFYSSLGSAYNALGEFENSDKSYDAALSFNPNDDITLNNYSYYLSLRGEKLGKAKEMIERVIRRNPENVTYLDTYAWVLYKQQDYEAAKEVMDRIIETNDVSAVNFDHYGDILYKLGDVNGAVTSWQKAKDLNSDIENIDKKISKRKVIE